MLVTATGLLGGLLNSLITSYGLMLDVVFTPPLGSAKPWSWSLEPSEIAHSLSKGVERDNPTLKEIPDSGGCSIR